MKRKKPALIALFIMTILSACNYGPVKEDFPNEEKLDAKTIQEEKAALSEPYKTALVFIKKKGSHWLVVDERGRTHEVSSPPFDPLPGAFCENGLVRETSPAEYEVTLDLPCTWRHTPKLNSTYDQAAIAYSKLLLDNLVYTGNESSAISEFKLHDVKYASGNFEGRIDVVMSFDVKPLGGAYLWGIPDDDGYVRGRTFSYTLYGAENTWLSTDDFYLFLGEDGQWPERPETLYTPTGMQKVIYEDDEWSYYSDGIMLPQQKEAEITDLTEYIGTINRIKRDTGESEQIYKGDKNTDYYYFAHHSDKIYILSHAWTPFSESYPGYFGVLNTKTKKYTRLIEGNVVRATLVGDQGYLFANDQLIEIDLKSASLRSVCQLPSTPNYANGYVSVQRVMDGKIYILMGMGDGKTEEYVVDIDSGEISSIVEP